DGARHVAWRAVDREVVDVDPWVVVDLAHDVAAGRGRLLGVDRDDVHPGDVEARNGTGGTHGDVLDGRVDVVGEVDALTAGRDAALVVQHHPVALRKDGGEVVALPAELVVPVRVHGDVALDQARVLQAQPVLRGDELFDGVAPVSDHVRRQSSQDRDAPVADDQATQLDAGEPALHQHTHAAAAGSQPPRAREGVPFADTDRHPTALVAVDRLDDDITQLGRVVGRRLVPLRAEGPTLGDLEPGGRQHLAGEVLAAGDVGREPAGGVGGRPAVPEPYAVDLGDEEPPGQPRHLGTAPLELERHQLAVDPEGPAQWLLLHRGPVGHRIVEASPGPGAASGTAGRTNRWGDPEVEVDDGRRHGVHCG